MTQINDLANQHILEWESRLGHRDAAKTYGEQLSLDLAGAEGLAADNLPTAGHPESGVRAALEATGLQLERVLGSVLGVEVPRRRKMDLADDP